MRELKPRNIVWNHFYWQKIKKKIDNPRTFVYLTHPDNRISLWIWISRHLFAHLKGSKSTSSFGAILAARNAHCKNSPLQPLYLLWDTKVPLLLVCNGAHRGHEIIAFVWQRNFTASRPYFKFHRTGWSSGESSWNLDIFQRWASSLGICGGNFLPSFREN